MRERIQELKEDVGENRLALIFSAFFASVLFIFIFARQHLYPFGDYTLLYVDGDQYASLMRMVNDAIASGESFFYSFRTVLGSGLIATEGYYATSPFNLLLFLFPDNLIAGIHFIACIKHICAALAFCVLLNACHEGMVAEKGIFSACYAFIGYMSFFAWNLSWMDGVIVLPLLVLGILRLVREKKTGLYAGALAFAVISNFYIGYMLCIASVMLYLVVVFAAGHADGTDHEETGLAGWRIRFQSLPWFAFASLTGVCLAGFILVPAFFGLPDDRKETIAELFRSMHPTLRPADLFSMLFTGRMCAQSANLPVIFSGILPLLLVVVFFFRSDVPRKKKLAALIVFGFLAFSFWNSMLNMIWHGMSENVWYNYRYSFVCSFFLLLLAFDTLSTINKANLSYYRVAVCLFVFCIWMYNDAQGAFYAEDITRDAVLLVAGVLILRYLSRHTENPVREKDERRSILVRGLLLALMCMNVYRNGVTVMWPDVKDSDSASAFQREVETAKEALARIPDEGFYRMEKNWRIGRADAPLLRYNGVSNYTSTENVELLETLRGMGIAHGWKWGYHTEHTPFATDTLLGFRYLFSKAPLQDSYYTETDETTGVRIYENEAALPLVMVAKAAGETVLSDASEQVKGNAAPAASTLSLLNEAYASFGSDAASGSNKASGNNAQEQKPVFTEIETTDHAESFLYYKIFTVDNDLAKKPLYLYLDFPVRTIYLYADEEASTIPYNAEQYVYNLGSFPAGTRVQVCLYVPQPVQLVETDEEQTGTTAMADAQGQIPGAGQGNAIGREDTAAGGVPADTQGVFIGEAGGTKDLQGENAGQNAAQTLPPAGEGYAYRYFRLSECLLYAEDPERVKEIAKDVQARTREVAVQGNRVRATVVADEAGFCVTTIPYEEGWRITVDGVAALPVRYLGQFLAFPVDAGEHVIDMHYVPRGFYAGVVLTVLAAVALVVTWFGLSGKRTMC